MGRFFQHSIAAAIATLLLIFVPNLAAACSCMQPEPATRLRGADAILDGYIERIERKENDQAIATIRVLRSWKGDLPSTVTLRYTLGGGSSCDGFGGLKPNTTFEWIFAHGDTRLGTLSGGFCDIAYSRPGNVLEGLVRDYASRHQALREAADRGTTRDVLAFAEFLLAHDDEPQAYDRLLPILQNEPDVFRKWVTDEGGHEALVRVRHQRDRKKGAMAAQSAMSPEGKVARAIFALTSVADPAWKDWSNIEPIGGVCHFDRATLSDASFAGSILPRCSFSGSTLTGVNFSGAQLPRAQFDGAHLINVDLSDTDLYGAVFDGSMIDTAQMLEVRGYSISFKDATVRNSEISGSLMGDFSRVALEKVVATRLTFDGDLSAATLRDVTFNNGRVTFVAKGARFENVRLTGTRLRGVHAESTDLNGVSVENAAEITLYTDCNTILPAPFLADPRALIPTERDCPTKSNRTDFKGVNWQYIDLRGLNFSNGDFTGATLTGAKLSGTDLSGANLSGLNFQHTPLSGAILDDAKLDRTSNLVWLASATNEGENLPPASLRGTTFSGTTIRITSLVGVIGQSDSIDLLAPNFDNVTLDCEERPLDYYMAAYKITEAKLAAQLRREARAIRAILARWPTAKLTVRCSEVQGLATSATP